MTVGMGRSERSRKSGAFKQRLISTLAVVGVVSAGLVSTAPSAVAADVQSKQWYLDAMHAKEMWKTVTGEGIKVAVIDTGVNPSTPSLKGQILKGMDATGATGDETDDYRGHGTTMAELIAGTGNGGGLKGLAPGAKIIPMRITDTQFQDEHSVNAHDSEDAIRAAADSGAQIISMSFASDFPSAEEREAVKYAQNKGKLFFAGVGNNAEKDNKEQFPASYPEVVGVAATDRNSKVSAYSQHGAIVDIAAPGDDIPRWCDEKFENYCYEDGGTSAATAIASASAALIWSAHPDWTANQVLRVLLDTAGRGDWEKGTLSNYLGHGVVRPAVNILRGKGDPGAPDVSPLTDEKTTSGSSAVPTASASASSQPPQKKNADAAVVTGSAEKPGEDSQVGLILGVAAGVVVLGAAAFVLVRRRRGV
ncbi:S8 family serine peptidase [Streptomyces sp. AM 4-1-1]|uniref:S8 family serine peptidase n=1 Tax=Streptomyces sp. AM 4-1-1 TaxID=3028710 RepID=UPI0023B98567|nr:S8 family serine peptidase [Streptomyces sp. AM 4-1-1]WEH36190.1 S8 family serine peptidase [Streptomyces sp. AM 4-1-1]